MNIRPLFKKYQKIILAFANTNVGKDYLDIKTDDKIVFLAPDGWHVKRDDIYRATFYPRSPYLKKFRLALESIEIASELFNFRKMRENLDFVVPHYLGLCRPQAYLPKIYFDTLTAFPDPDPETTTVDGNVARTGVNETFATIRAGAGVTAEPSASVGDIYLEATATSNQYLHLYRNIDLFDTSSIPNTAAINSSTISLWSRAVPETGLGDLNVNVYLSTPASNTNLVAADYAQVGTVAQATAKATSTFTNGQYSDWTLNATGLTNIIKAGITKFCFRFTNDADNSAPTWASGARTFNALYNAEQAGTTNDPKLTVDYSLPSAGGYKTLLGVGL